MSTAIRLIVVPYDSGVRDERMGKGPRALLSVGVAGQLERQGLSVEVAEVEAESGFLTEIATAFELQRGVRRAAEAAMAEGSLPITLSGNCNTGVIGSLAAHGSKVVGLLWFDAHSDAETPESSTSGFLDGTGLAMALGCCWSSMLSSVGSWKLEGRQVALVGAREISRPADKLLRDKGVAVVPPEQARRGELASAIAQLREAGVSQVHVHVDLDVLDCDAVGRANSFALPDGLSEAQLLRLIRHVGGGLDIASASVASYDPDVDTSGSVGAAGAEVVRLLATRGRGA